MIKLNLYDLTVTYLIWIALQKQWFDLRLTKIDLDLGLVTCTCLTYSHLSLEPSDDKN